MPRRPPSLVAALLPALLSLGALLVTAAPAFAGDPQAPADPASIGDGGDPKSVASSTEVPSIATAGPRWLARPWLVSAHLSGGFEILGDALPVGFGAGGQILWRGIIGPAAGLYASAGSPIKPKEGSPGYADRVSATIALAARPLAIVAWDRPDRWVNRFLTGITVEAGPSFEYLRTSSFELPGCTIPAVAYKPGAHLALAFDVPLVGDAGSGWLALRAAARVTVDGSETRLAPVQLGPGAPCTPQVVQPSYATQLFFGLSYYR